MSWQRLVALGDSIAAGIREPSPGYRDLGWVDRIAQALDIADVRNLGERDRLAGEVRAQQLPAALTLAPDLAILSAGGNDALRPSFDAMGVEAELDAIVGALRGAGADVLTLELLGVRASPYVPEKWKAPLDARLRELGDVTRRVAERHGAVHVELREHPASDDPTIYASDGLHLNAKGHAVVAQEAIARLEAARAAGLPASSQVPARAR